MKLFNKNIILAAASISLMSCTPIYKKMNVDKETYEGLNDGLYANLQTTKGNMIVKFEDKKAPVTVANFIGLAEGKIDNKAKAKGVPYYDGTIFHRVIKDFMIQGEILREQEWEIQDINSKMKETILNIQEKVFFLWRIQDQTQTVLSSSLLKWLLLG
jgi:hypothetical protein